MANNTSERDEFDAWQRCVDVINSLLGLGFERNGNKTVDNYFAEVSSDFGVPTTSDITDFITAARKLPRNNGKQVAAVEGVLDALKLYQFFQKQLV